MMTRRPFLKLLSSSVLAGPFAGELRAEDNQFPIGACDWSIGKKQDVAAFDVAKTIGLEGLQVSFSNPATAYDLRDPAVRETYFQKSEETGVRIASLAMGILNQEPLATNPESIEWVSQVIDTIAAMQQERPGAAPSVCLLAFFGKGDINGRRDLQDEVIRKLKTVAPKAEEHGVILGIESYLSADDHLRMIDGVGSDSIQVYYDSANSDKMGYNIYDEVVQIGSERICEVHCKENKALLGTGVVDFPRFRDSLKKAGYSDWLILESGVPKNADVVDSQKANLVYLDRTFRKNA